MSKARQLIFSEIASDKAFHAAYITQHGHVERVPHTHDFWEIAYVLDGTGMHWLDGRMMQLVSGQMLLIRPHDYHAVYAHGAKSFQFYNLAFPETVWRTFCAVAGLKKTLIEWEAAPLPPTCILGESDEGTCLNAFNSALYAFVERPTSLDLCRFWSAILPLFTPEVEQVIFEKTAPAWLRGALIAMQSEENLRLGLPQLVALSAVSPAHLSRTLKAIYGQTPTDFINGLRLRRSCLLLRTTSWKIIDIAYDCGFHNLSYFYRLFIARYAQTPRAYRLAAHNVFP